MWAVAPVPLFYNDTAFVRKGTVYLSQYTIQCEYMKVPFRRLHAIGVKLRCGTISVIICLYSLRYSGQPTVCILYWYEAGGRVESKTKNWLNILQVALSC